MKMRVYFQVVLFIFLAIFSLAGVSAFEFNGTVYDIDGNPLNNSVVNVTIRNSDFSVNGYNFTTTNSSGWFNLSVAEISNAFYEPLITWENTSVNSIQYVGQSLPSFPSQILTDVAGTSFYLREAGTINITAINSTGDRITFRYQVKDQKLGYSVSENFESAVSEKNVVLPRDRNYSIMIYPDASMPVSFNWNNFSSGQSYDLSTLSNYNFTTKKLDYQFNTTMNIVRVSGYINHSAADGWDEFTVVPYMLEPGNMVHVDFGDMPYNISSFNGGSDIYTLSSGFYNISLPSTPAETSSMLLFASARNGSNYYGGFRNITSLGSGGLTQFNFSSISGLFGAAANISMETIAGGGVNVSTAKQTFNLLNATNGSLTNIDAHIEITLDYSDQEAIEFTWMLDINQGGSSSFLAPLLNSTGIKEMNVFVGGGNYAPKKVSYFASELGDEKNITISNFNPGDIDGALENTDIFMGLIISNSTCDVPSINESCFIGGISSQGLDEFNPMQAIIGGGRLSFVMGTSSIKVHYVNVDMLASGPPDALFESSTSESTSDGFESALRFGSQGPTIYDYALVQMPYTEGGSSTTGLDETSEVNISIPLFYDDDWNVIWNSTVNGTNASALSGNYSHYAARQGEWQTLLDGATCHTNGDSAEDINATDPCYIDTDANKIVLRIPHFSGTGPEISGSVITATSTNTGSSSSGGGGGSSAVPDWVTSYKEDDVDFSEKKNVEKELRARQRIRLKLGEETHHVGVKSVQSETVTIEVASKPREAVLAVGESARFDVSDNGLYDLLVRVVSISSGKATLSIDYIQEKVVGGDSVKEDSDADLEVFNSPEFEESEASGASTSTSSRRGWVIFGILAAVLIGLAAYFIVRRRNSQ